jgi:hypothetical protein
MPAAVAVWKPGGTPRLRTVPLSQTPAIGTTRK